MTISQQPDLIKESKKQQKDENEIPEEDLELVENLKLCVERIKEETLMDSSLEILKSLIKSSTSSMTSVPKPLKYLKEFHLDLIAVFEKSGNKKLADVLSVLAMAFENVGDCLKYRFLGSMEDVGVWGHEYCRHLSSELIQVYGTSTEKEKLMKQALELIPFFMKHNGEADACDLLIELENLQEICKFVDKENYKRVCLYILGCVMYVTPPDDVLILKVAHQIYRDQLEFPSAIQVALKLGDQELIQGDFDTCSDEFVMINKVG